MAKRPDYYFRIKSLKKRYLELKRGKDSLLQIINEAEISEYVYNSNAIENSTLSLEETEKILLEIDLDRFINQRELFEAKNLARVISYLENKKQQFNFSLDLMLLLHKMLLSNIRDDIAGRFREENEWVRVGSHIAPNPLEITKRLEEMLEHYEQDFDLHLLEKIAKQHLSFEYIHPFVDGNGRIGRVLINYLLAKEGYPPINIRFKNRKTYYKAFEEYQLNSKSKVMESILGLALTNSLHKRLTYLEDKEIISLKEYSKRTKESHSSLLNKASRQTIPAFHQKDKWFIGV